METAGWMSSRIGRRLRGACWRDEMVGSDPYHRQVSVPDRQTAAVVLLELDPPPGFLRHARAVAEVAGWIAARCAANGQPVDRRLVEAAALLHDVDKILPAADPNRSLPHGEGSAAWLRARGLGELAPAVAGHTVTLLATPRPEPATGALEASIVAYADRRAVRHVVSLDARFARWRRRHPVRPPGPAPDGDERWSEVDFEQLHRAAAQQEAAVCRAAGIRPDEVRRLHWTAEALRSARRTAEPARSAQRGAAS